MAKRTVLIATPYFYPTVGGLENYALALARGLSAQGFKVVVVCGDRVPSVKRAKMEAFTVYRLPIWLTISNTPFNPMWYFYLRRIIRAEKPNIINAHMPVPFMADMCALAKGKTAFVVTYHAATLFKRSSLLLKLITAAYLPIQQLTLGRARSIFAVSPYVKASLPAAVRTKTFVMPNATAVTDIPKSAANTDLVFIANLEKSHAWKGLDLIIDALGVLQRRGTRVPTLTVIGDGNYRGHYEAKVNRLGLSENVTFRGRLVGDDRNQAMAAARAMVLYPTTANDAFPTVMLEAWSLKVPVIAANIGALSTLVEDHVTGVLVKPASASDLADTLVMALSDNRRLKAMGRAGRRSVEAKYNWEVQSARTGQLLEQLA